jgi:hypothetical protein
LACLKTLNHVLLTLASDQKTKPSHKYFAKNKTVESTDYETGLPDATLTEE